MVLLHDAIKTIQNGAFVCFFQEQKTVSSQKNKKIWIKKTCFFKETGFSQPWLSFNPICDFPLIARSGTSHVTISLIGFAPHT